MPIWKNIAEQGKLFGSIYYNQKNRHLRNTKNNIYFKGKSLQSKEIVHQLRQGGKTITTKTGE